MDKGFFYCPIIFKWIITIHDIITRIENQKTINRQNSNISVILIKNYREKLKIINDLDNKFLFFIFIYFF